MVVPPARWSGWWRSHRIGVGVLCSALLSVWLVIAIYWEATASRLRETLPNQIGVGKLVAEGDNIPFVCYLIALCREVCGGFAFRLTDETAAALTADGMRPLYGAKVSRGRSDNRPDDYLYSFEPWQPTPVPAAWTEEGLLSGLQCWSDRNLDRGAVTKAAAAPGSYFTTGSGRSTLLVIPSMRLAVFMYGP